jgi:putative addiction module component (TIGR02574 family)
MKPVDIQELLRLSISERLDLVEALWESIAASPEALPITDAQQRELDRRLADYRANPSHVRSWDEVRDSPDDDR